jgi:DNA-binding NarL/FixJ family response regulator
MVVDDQPPFRSAARALIKRIKEFELVDEAESGEQAIEFARQHRPDLVLMDINMGAVDGIEATREITGASPTTMIILVSTYGEDDLPARARGCGASGYVNKDELTPGVVRELWAGGGEPGWRLLGAQRVGRTEPRGLAPGESRHRIDEQRRPQTDDDQSKRRGGGR